MPPPTFSTHVRLQLNPECHDVTLSAQPTRELVGMREFISDLGLRIQVWQMIGCFEVEAGRVPQWPSLVLRTTLFYSVCLSSPFKCLVLPHVCFGCLLK